MAIPPAVDRRIYRQSPERIVPHSIYFYYMTLDPVEIKRYYFDNLGPIGNIDDLIKFLTVNARNGRDLPPQISDTAKMRRQSYLVLLLDSDTERLVGGEAIVFYDGAGMYKDNFAFFDGEDKIIDLATIPGRAELRSAVLCANHMFRDDQYNELWDDEVHPYRFKIRYGTRLPVLEVDSGGTNMGPPVPPPVLLPIF
jgi:hypothetical protein